MIQRRQRELTRAWAATKGNRARSLHLHDMRVCLPLWFVGLTPRSTIVVGFGAIGPEAAAGASERVRAGVRLEHVSRHIA